MKFSTEKLNAFFAKFKKLKSPSKKVFWVWVGYQAVKGTITTTFIWIPLLYAWWHHTQ